MAVRDEIAAPHAGRRGWLTRSTRAVSPRRLTISAALATLLASLLGLASHAMVEETGYARPGERNIFFRLYALHERPFLLLLGAFAVASLLLFAWRRARPDEEPAGAERLAAPAGMPLFAVALVVGVVALATTHLVFHRALLSMDEFSFDFQARLFARGEIAATVPWPWRSLRLGITPIFVGFNTATGDWLAQYLPVYALLKAPFVALGVPTLLNPLLAALSIVAMASVARPLWPGEGLRPWVALGLLATSAEVLLTSGTGYSMPAHLLFNLVWLRLYQRGDARAWAAALVVGALALGLHNPFPHALFVAPFLLRIARERRWRRLGAAIAVYGVTSIAWAAWLRFVYLDRGAEGGTTSLFAIPSTYTAWVHGMNFTLLLNWHAPALGILLMLTLANARRLGPLLTDLGLGVLLTFGFFTFFASTQGHGWGYRYVYQVLGSLCLLAAASVPVIEAAVGRVATRRWLVAALVIAVLCQLPARLLQTERFARPFAKAHAYLQSRDARVVLVSGEHIWYGRDLLRNDPFLRGPIIVDEHKLAPGTAEALERALPGRVVRVRDEEMLTFGMTPRNPRRLFVTPP